MVVLKGVRAGVDIINVNVGVAAGRAATATGTALVEREEPISDQADVPPPPYVEGKEVGESESGRVGEGSGDSAKEVKPEFDPKTSLESKSKR